MEVLIRLQGAHGKWYVFVLRFATHSLSTINIAMEMRIGGSDVDSSYTIYLKSSILLTSADHIAVVVRTTSQGDVLV